ncbi:MAG TPA: SUMF1/EgtB/PvdO family nonheme iron enzyme, partial [Pirellulaceae bacterium]|nr:SUMF1/EgtB/PvdO family nonheme iron enzyme [Pirellulaceae bacterium]
MNRGDERREARPEERHETRSDERPGVDALERRGLVGRADLVRAWSTDKSLRDQLATSLDFEFVPRIETVDQGLEDDHSQGEGGLDPSPIHPPDVEGVTTRFAPAPIQFCRPVAFEERAASTKSGAVARVVQPGVSPSETRRRDDAGTFEPLAPLQEVLARLQHLTEVQGRGGECDVDEIVRQTSRGRVLTDVPWLSKRTWGQGVLVVQDASHRLSPYYLDMGLVVNELKRRLPKTALWVGQLPEGQREPVIHWPAVSRDGFQRAPAGATVLVLGDLGQLDGRRDSLGAMWRDVGRRLSERGVRCTALTPCDIRNVPAELRDVWTVIPWDRRRQCLPRESYDNLLQRAETLLSLLSFAVVIEPWLLRRLRRAIPEFQGLAELEGLAWQLPGLRYCGRTGAMISREWRESFERSRIAAPDAMRQLSAELVAAEHRDAYDGLRFAEILNLGVDAGIAFSADEVARAIEYFESLGAEDVGGEQSKFTERIEFFRSVASHFTQRARDFCPALDRNWLRYLQDVPGAAPPANLDPARLRKLSGEPRVVEIRQLGDGLQFSWADAADVRGEGGAAGGAAGSPVVSIRTSVDRIRVERLFLNDGDLERPFDLQTEFWAEGRPPDWAQRWGLDEFGVWAEFEVRAGDGFVAQRLRWVPPGSFMMGSPDDEPGRWDDEGPRHSVTIGRGFWLADTPCIQSLWEAVTGANPSQFPTPDRPVETVSWNDCQTFLEKLRTLIPSLEIDLPTEAEWE